MSGVRQEPTKIDRQEFEELAREISELANLVNAEFVVNSYQDFEDKTIRAGMELCDFEKDVLKSVAGIPQESVQGWGAALSEAVSFLSASGYLRPKHRPSGLEYVLTEKGRDVIS